MPDWTSRQAEGGVPADATFVTVNAEGDLSAETVLSSLALLKANNLSDVANAATARSNIGAGTGNGDLLAANNLSDVTAATARGNLELGTAATLDVGAGASNVVQLDGTAKLPAVDGSQLTNLPGAGIANVVDDTTPQLGGTLDANAKQVRLAKGADVASVAALALGTDGNYFDITGVVAITSIGTLGIGTVVTLHFDGILTLTHHATDLILPGGANIATAAGDEATFIEYAAGDWRCVNYTKASGEAIVSGGGASWTLIEEIVAANSATVDFETGIGDTYDRYLVECFGVYPTTGFGELLARLGIESPVTYQTTSYSYGFQWISNASSGFIQASGQGALDLVKDLGDATKYTTNGWIEFNNPEANVHTNFMWMFTQSAGNGAVRTAIGGGSHDAQSVMTAFRLYLSASNLNGTFRLWGKSKT